MTQTSVFTRRLPSLGAPLLTALLLTLSSCDRPGPLTEPEGVEAGSNPAGTEAPSLAIAYAGGIPFGLSAMPTNQYGSIYNGALRNARDIVQKGNLNTELAAIKSRGGKVFLQLSGNHQYYLDSDGHFSMTKWKERVNLFKSINFSSYINDGTIIAHFLIDEPNDPRNWGGRPVPGSTVEAMAKYSKQLWPGMPTVVRAEASYLAKWPGYIYLDALWAHYVYRLGDPADFINRNVAGAKNLGLELVTGLNIMKGGPDRTKMTPTQIKTWGSVLLNSSYPCAFISWKYNSIYFSTTAVRDAMKSLRAKAQNRTFKDCRS